MLENINDLISGNKTFSDTVSELFFLHPNDVVKEEFKKYRDYSASWIERRGLTSKIINRVPEFIFLHSIMQEVENCEQKWLSDPKKAEHAIVQHLKKCEELLKNHDYIKLMMHLQLYTCNYPYPEMEELFETYSNAEIFYLDVKSKGRKPNILECNKMRKWNDQLKHKLIKILFCGEVPDNWK